MRLEWHFLLKKWTTQKKCLSCALSNRSNTWKFQFHFSQWIRPNHMGHETNVFFLFRLLLFRFITRLYVKELIRTLTHAIWFTYASHSIQYRNKIVNPMWTYSILFCSPSSYRCIDGPATNKHVKGKNLYTKQTNYINVKFHRRRRRRRRCYGWAVCCCFEFFLFSFFEKDRNKYHANISSLVYSQLIPIFYAKSATVLFSQTNSRIMTKNCQLQTNAMFSGAQ